MTPFADGSGLLTRRSSRVEPGRAISDCTGILRSARLALTSRHVRINGWTGIWSARPEGSNLSEINERKPTWLVTGLALRGTVALLVASAVAAVSGLGTQVVAAPAISVFVGYADSARAGGEFPNPWNGAPNVTFDGCSPQSACTFDAGAIRIRNDNTASVVINQVNVHLGACMYTWSGPIYGVVLAPGASLITTQRSSGVAAGCTGPDPSTFDSSDIPNRGTCTNDGIQATVDVIVDGATTTYADSGQVLNTGGVDPGACTGGDEATQWVRIGSEPCPGQTLSLVPTAQSEPVGTTATVSAIFTDSCGNPLSDVAVGFKVTAGPNAGKTGSGLTDSTGTATFSYASSVTGIDSLQANVTNAVGFITTSNSATVTWTIVFAPGGGSFVIGNDNAVLGNTVNFWGSQWAWHNSLTGGLAPRSFKGYADQPATPACGEAWTSDPGNSTPPPDGPLPQLMAVIVTSSVHQTGPEISGDIVEIVVVKTDPGYHPNPGHAGRGSVVAVICGAAGPAPIAQPQSHQLLSSSPPAGSGGSGLSPRVGATASATPCQVNARGRSTTLPSRACARKTS